MTQRQKTIKETLSVKTFAALQRGLNDVSDEIYHSLIPHRLSVSQFRVLEALHKHGPLFQVDLARHILKTAGNITTVIDNLEKLGLVERIRGKRDRRYFQIVLTIDGAKLIKKMYPVHIKRVEKVLGKLSDVEQAELARICAKLEKIRK